MRAGRVSSTPLVRYRCNDPSVPTAYGFRDVLVKGFVEEVVILCGGIEVARHLRSYPHLPRTIVRTTVAADTALVPEAAA